MRWLLLSVVVFGCTGTEKSDDSAATGGIDSADTDTDTDTDTDADTDNDPATASVSGMVVGYDGAMPVGLEVQVCDLICYPVQTAADGSFVKTDLKAGSYKVDAIGTSIDGDYGVILVNATLDQGEVFSFSDTLYLPKMVGPKTLTGAPLTFDTVTLTADTSAFKVPFGYDDNVFWAGRIEGADVPALWEIDTVTVAVAFMPVATEVNAPFSVSVSGDFPAGNYDVYSADEKGVKEGPLGTAVSDGSTLRAEDIQPTILSWLLFSPQN